MKAIKQIAIIAAMSAAAAAHAEVDPAVVAQLKSLYPATTFNEINTTPIPGVYEVVMGKNIAYVEPNGRYFIFGHLFDMKTQRDLSAEKLPPPAEVAPRKIDLSKLPLNDAVKIVKGTGKRQLIVFSDPDCPFCKRLEQSLAGVTDVTIYTFLFPIEGLHPQAKGKSVGVWCAGDQVKAWNDLMLEGKATFGECDHPVERNVKLAGELGIAGTPTLIFADGEVVPGAIPVQAIQQKLGGGA